MCQTVLINKQTDETSRGALVVQIDPYIPFSHNFTLYLFLLLKASVLPPHVSSFKSTLLK